MDSDEAAKERILALHELGQVVGVTATTAAAAVHFGKRVLSFSLSSHSFDLPCRLPLIAWGK